VVKGKNSAKATFLSFNRTAVFLYNVMVSEYDLEADSLLAFEPF